MWPRVIQSKWVFIIEWFNPNKFSNSYFFCTKTDTWRLQRFASWGRARSANRQEVQQNIGAWGGGLYWRLYARSRHDGSWFAREIEGNNCRPQLIMITDHKRFWLQTSPFIQKSGSPWSIAKSFDTSCPVGSFVPREQIPNHENLELWCKVNNEMRQHGQTDMMIFKLSYLISYISKYFTLEVGDLILTGTPKGVGQVKSGDLIECGLVDRETKNQLINMQFTVEWLLSTVGPLLSPSKDTIFKIAKLN